MQKNYFDSKYSVVGLDFIAKSIIALHLNGTWLNAMEITGNMTHEQKEIIMARVEFHCEILNVASPWRGWNSTNV